MYNSENITDLSGMAENAKPRKRMWRAKYKMYIWRLSVGSAYYLKRILDIVVSIFMILLLLPLLVLTAILIKLESKGPVIFRQARVGKDGRHFTFYKFRSMFIDADSRKEQILSRKRCREMAKEIFSRRNFEQLERRAIWGQFYFLSWSSC